MGRRHWSVRARWRNFCGQLCLPRRSVKRSPRRPPYPWLPTDADSITARLAQPPKSKLASENGALSAVPMVRFLQAGLLAAQHQLALVVVITILSMIASHVATQQGGSSETIDVVAFWESASPFLTWAYLLAAAGLAVTSGEHIDETAENIKQAAHSGRLGPTKLLLERLVGQSSLCSVLFAVLVLWDAPRTLVDATRYFGLAAAAPV